MERAYGVWLRAPSKNTKMQNMGSKWLRNGPDGIESWQAGTIMEEVLMLQRNSWKHRVLLARFQGLLTEFKSPTEIKEIHKVIQVSKKLKIWYKLI